MTWRCRLELVFHALSADDMYCKCWRLWTYNHIQSRTWFTLLSFIFPGKTSRVLCSSLRILYEIRATIWKRIEPNTMTPLSELKTRSMQIIHIEISSLMLNATECRATAGILTEISWESIRAYSLNVGAKTRRTKNYEWNVWRLIFVCTSSLGEQENETRVTHEFHMFMRSS